MVRGDSFGVRSPTAAYGRRVLPRARQVLPLRTSAAISLEHVATVGLVGEGNPGQRSRLVAGFQQYRAMAAIYETRASTTSTRAARYPKPGHTVTTSSSPHGRNEKGARTVQAKSPFEDSETVHLVPAGAQARGIPQHHPPSNASKGNNSVEVAKQQHGGAVCPASPSSP